MGIKGLIKYASKYRLLQPITEIEFDNYIYKSNIVYIDAIFKLLEIYSDFKCENIEQTLENLIDYVSKKLKEYLINLKYYNQINFFIDIHITKDLGVQNIYFKDFIPKPSDFSKSEVIYANSLIKRKHIQNIDGTIDYNKILDEKESKVRCLYEFFNRDYKLREYNIENYIGLSYLYCRTNNEEIKEKICSLINHGWYRYLVRRGGKLSITNKRNHRNHLFQSVVPFRNLIYNFSHVIKKINDIPNVYYFGCFNECDFSIAKHIKVYNKNSYPTIMTNDTDLLSILCDIPCIVKLYSESEKKHKIYVLETISFWKNIFESKLDPKIIKILCVLMGTDYNPFSEESPIHIKEFFDILSYMKLKKYDEITLDSLKKYIFDIMIKNDKNIYCKKTALAINIYLNNIENSICELGIETDKYLKKMIESTE